MATLTGKQLKDSYQGLLTIKTADDANPLSGRLENGLGNAITNLGIGTDSPSEKLHILGTNSGLRIDGGTSYTNTSTITLSNGRAKIDSEIINGTAQGDTAIRLYNRVSGSLAERMKINHFGDISFRDTSANEAFYWDASTARLGIGTTDPSALLHVEGSVKFGDNTSGLAFSINSTDEYRITGIDTSSSAFNSLHFRADGTDGLFIEKDTNNVGIGTTSPSTNLEIDGGTSTTVFINSSTHSSGTANEAKLQFGYGHSGGPDAIGYIKLNENSTNSFDGTMTFGVPYNNGSGGSATRDALVIKNDGNVGIGTTSPGATLHIANTSPSFLIDDTDSNVVLRMAAGSSASYIQSGTDVVSDSAAPLVFGSIFNTTEWMRIDSSGNVLVGTNTYSFASVGAGFASSGQVFATRDSDTSAVLSRNTTDGTILQFRKDNTEVGSISSKGGTNIIVGSSDCAISYQTGVLRPRTTTDTTSDNALDLGESGSRFKDLYLGGSVYLGGTTSANALDDYEEGTHDVTITCTTSGTITLDSAINSLSYTKIGRLMTVTGQLSVTSVSSPTGNVTISLPTTIADLSERAGRSTGSVIVTGSSSNVDDYFLNGLEGDAFVYIRKGGSTAGSDSAQEFSGDEYITINFSYVSA